MCPLNRMSRSAWAEQCQRASIYPTKKQHQAIAKPPSRRRCWWTRCRAGAKPANCQPSVCLCVCVLCLCGSGCVRRGSLSIVISLDAAAHVAYVYAVRYTNDCASTHAHNMWPMDEGQHVVAVAVATTGGTIIIRVTQFATQMKKNVHACNVW